MTLHPKLAELQARAEAFATDDVMVGFDTAGGKDATAIAICDRRSGMSYIVLVDNEEYDGVTLAHLLGFPYAPPQTAIERLPERPAPARKKRR